MEHLVWYVGIACFGASIGILVYDLLFRRHFDKRMNKAIKKAYEAGVRDGQALPTSWEEHTRRIRELP